MRDQAVRREGLKRGFVAIEIEFAVLASVMGVVGHLGLEAW